MKRKVLVVFIVIIATIGSIAYRMYSKQTPDAVKDEPAAVVSAEELLSAFEKDAAAASSAFMDKTIEVTGVIKSRDTSGAVVMGEKGSLSEIVIGLDRRHIRDIEKLTTGQMATMQGVVSGYSKSSSDPDDLLAGLGTTVQMRSAGIKHNK